MIFMNCLNGPRLYSIFGKKNLYYEPNTLELIGQCAIQFMSILKTITIYASPIILYYIHRYGHISYDYMGIYAKLSFVAMSIFSLSYIIRGIGRYNSIYYMTFIQEYNKHLTSRQHMKEKLLNTYDFDLTFWPPNFEVNLRPDINSFISQKQKYKHILPLWKEFLYKTFSYLANHTFLLKMAYPGATTLMQILLGQSLNEGRFNLIACYKGKRAKLGLWNGNGVDVMFLDKREVPSALFLQLREDQVTQNVKNNQSATLETNYLGSYLLIVCEGNASYYEIGCMTSFLDSGFSILGWNHPGFGQSTGQPTPEDELTAIHAVVEYALKGLHFSPEKILFYGWSIGSFTAAWAAAHIPNNRALILDGAFDDILPLALNRMPALIENLVVYTIRKYLDLRIIQYITRDTNTNFVLIRRTQDEIMNMREGDLSSNRGNHLIVKILKNRYPAVFTADVRKVIQDSLAERLENMKNETKFDEFEENLGEEQPFVSAKEGVEPYTDNEENDDDIPKVTSTSDVMDTSLLGYGMDYKTKLELAFKLLNRHLVDYDGSHCDPLPKHFFLKLILNL